jgi:hypothetical protein
MQVSTLLHEPRRRLALLFTGHMIDVPDRASPRFPPALEPLAGAAIRERISALREKGSGSIIGIAGGACGGDILFHEGCEAVGVPTILVLPFGMDAFLERSVRSVNTGEWELRFETLWQRLPSNRRIILSGADAPDPFGACNDAMLATAQRIGAGVELLALWDGADSGKSGGTAAFASAVRDAGGHVTPVYTNPLLAALTKSGV